MLELVRRARRRLLNAELISQGANAFSAALAAFILLLILGTQILEWYWLVLIPLAAVAAGVYLAFGRLPSPYRTAQLVDHRAQLADTLSTALYFSDENAPSSADVLRWQRERAEEAAGQVDLPRVLPYSMPRSVYIVAALALVASSLFALRYGLNRRLDLKPPLARMILDRFTPPDKDKKQVAENRRTPPGKDDADTNDSASQDQNKQAKDQDQQNAADPSDQGDSPNADKSGESKDQASKQNNGDQNQDGRQSQDQQADDRDQQNSGEKGSDSQGESKGESKQQSDGKQNSNNAGESGSLLSKMKDFAENLLSKIKPEPKNNSNQQQQSENNQNSKQGQGQQQKGQQQNSKDGQQGSSDKADSQQGQSGDQKDGQDSQGKGAGDKSQQANKQPGSGIGSEDGDKAIKRAEQLAAMGKITELIGKRSATVTGESTVEVQNTSQQLHTAYVQRGDAQHQQSGAQIDRDEIPVALQPYVEQYFDQLRKQPAAATPAAPKKQQ